MNGTAAELAAEALRTAETEPARATALVEAALAASGGDLAIAADGARALGLALREGNDLAGSTKELRRAMALARRAGDADREAEALVSLALNQSLVGRTKEALAGLDVAEAASARVGVAAAGQRALVLMRAGRFEEAVAAYERAVRGARAQGMQHAESKFLNNRALLHCWRGDTSAAQRDLERAATLSAAIGDEAGVASAGHNLGWVLGRRGDLPAALAALDDAEARYAQLGMGDDELLVDRAELLLQARLVGEALEASERAVDALRRKRVFADLAVARLLLSEAQLLAGRADEARRTADTAARSFAGDGRTAWAALARAAAIRARIAASTDRPTARLQRDVLLVADELAASGWAVPALDARLMAATLAFERGDVAAGASAVEAARGARRGGPADLRVRAWHAEALARLAKDDRRGAAAALRRGLTVLDEHRAALGATELRAHASGHGERLARLGLRLAVQGRRPSDVLAWSEHHRAQSLRLRPVRPPDDPALADVLATLRGVAADLEQARREGDDARRLVQRRSELEREVSALTRRVAGEGTAARPWDGSRRRQLHAELADADAVLVSFVADGAALLAVAVDGHRVVVHDVGAVADAMAEVEAVAFALRRLARPRLPATTADAAAASLSRAGAALDEQLLGPVRHHLDDDRAVVLVPTGGLHALAWSALPSLATRPVAVVPSISMWLDARHRRDVGGGVALIAGPELAAADGEVAAIAALVPSAVVLDLSASSAAAVLTAIDGARLAHFATHGRFRADNPSFSSLLVADGPLLVHDLARLDVAPRLVLLSACESATTGLVAGDELLGLLASLFSLGSNGVVASVVPVPDVATARLMEGVHRALRSGRSPAEALAQARTAASASGRPDDLAAGLAFNAYGDVLSSA